MSVYVLVSMTYDSIFAIVLYSSDHEHMRAAEISLKDKENLWFKSFILISVYPLDILSIKKAREYHNYL